MRQSDIVYTKEVLNFLSNGWVIVPDRTLCGINITRLRLQLGDEMVVITRGNKGYTVTYSNEQFSDRIVKFKEEILWNV